MAAKWFGVVAERRFIIVKWFVWIRGYHESDEVSSEVLKFCAKKQRLTLLFVESYKRNVTLILICQVFMRKCLHCLAEYDIHIIRKFNVIAFH